MLVDETALVVVRSTGLTDSQEKLLSLLSLPSALLSLLASSSILYMIWKLKFENPYLRILFVLSITDILVAFTFAVQPFLLPHDTSGFVWAFGTNGTCNMIGILTQLNLINPLYNVALSFYFLCIIKYQVSKADFRRKYEYWIHGIGIGFPVSMSILVASLDMYRELEIGPFCWIGVPLEHECEENPHLLICNANAALAVAWGSLGLWVLVSLMAIVGLNVQLFRYVRSILHRGRERSLNTTTQDRHIQQVAAQAFWFVACFIGTYIWSVLVRTLDSQTEGVDDGVAGRIFPLSVLQALLTPLTGCFNLIIFLRPRYIRLREKNPAMSRCGAIREAYVSQFDDGKRATTTTSSSVVNRSHWNGGSIAFGRPNNNNNNKSQVSIPSTSSMNSVV